MGLFNFLKPKKGPSAELMKHPAMVGMELEYLQKQVANLISVNRSEDAQKAVNAFLLKYEKDSIGIAASRIDLVRISYSLAYFLLPSLVYTRWNEFCDLWNGGIPFPVYVAIKGANSNGKHLSMEQIQEFKYYQGNLEDELTYFLIQFPEPPESKEDASLESLLAKLEQKKY